MIVTTFFTSIINFFTSVYFYFFVAVVISISFISYLYLARNFGKWEKQFGLKGMKPVPFFGTEMEYLLGKKDMHECVLEKYRFFEGHKFGIVYQGAKPTIFIRDVELLKSVCISDFEYFTDCYGPGAEAAAGHNVFFMRGEKWKKSKSALNSAFSIKSVNNVWSKLNICIKRSMNQIDSFAKTGDEVNMDDVVEVCLLDAVGFSVCGVDFGLEKNSNSELSEMVHLLHTSVWKFVLLNIAPELMNFLGIKLFNQTAYQYFDKLLRQLIKHHEETKKYDDLVGLHVKAKEEMNKKSSPDDEINYMTDDAIIGSCVQFFFDGIIIVTAVINIAVFNLAQDEEMQDKAFNDIQNVMGDRMFSSANDTLDDLPPITDNDLSEMKYIEQLYQECLRVGAFPFIWRKCTKDYPMPGTNFVVPKGTPVYIPIKGYLMDPNYFPDPEKFDPERFSPENKNNIVKGSYCPFGQGPRMCMGPNFVRMEEKAYLANLIRSFRIHSSESTGNDLVWDTEGSNTIKGGVRVKVSRRET